MRAKHTLQLLSWNRKMHNMLLDMCGNSTQLWVRLQSMYVCMHIACMYVWMHIPMYACMHECTYGCMYACMPATKKVLHLSRVSQRTQTQIMTSSTQVWRRLQWMYAGTYLCTYVYMHAYFMYVCTYACIYERIYACIYVCMHACT